MLPETTAAQQTRRRATSRVTAGLVAVALVVVGVAVSRLDHPLADPVGDALYAAFVFALLVAHRDRVRQQLAEVATHLEAIEYKIGLYERSTCTLT